jgi:catechol 2,3-dioxygenase-like lactoylglutathione lyase family enzyme
MIPMETDVNVPGRVIGLGGVFFKSVDRDKLQAWYAENLGITAAGPDGFMFQWRAHDQPEAEHFTVWSVFPRESNYFDPSAAPFMINYIVDNLDAILAKLAAQGVRIDPKREDHDYGRFAWIYDPDGNKIELWEPPNPSAGHE